MNTPAADTHAVEHDWGRLNAMIDGERHAAALGDPDARPLAPDDMNLMKRTPQARVIRRALALSQEAAARD